MQHSNRCISEFNIALIRLINYLDITMKDVSDISGVGYSTITRCCKNYSLVSMGTMTKVIKAVSDTYGELISYKFFSGFIDTVDPKVSPTITLNINAMRPQVSLEQGFLSYEAIDEILAILRREKLIK